MEFGVTYQTEYIFESKNKKPVLDKADQIQVVYGKQESLKIRKNGNAQLTLQYIPMSMYKTKTTILFLNPVIG